MITYEIHLKRAGNNNGLSIDELVAIAKQIPLETLKQKAIEYGIEPYLLCDIHGQFTVDEFVGAYKEIPSKDLTIRKEEDDGDYIVQSASGYCNCRNAKEVMRRAFSMLLIEECFKKGYNVSLEIYG